MVTEVAKEFQVTNSYSKTVKLIQTYTTLKSKVRYPKTISRYVQYFRYANKLKNS